MSLIKKASSLPVVSENVHDQFMAAFARIAEVPVNVSIITDLTDDEFLADIDGCIDAGSDETDDTDLATFDAEVRLCA